MDTIMQNKSVVLRFNKEVIEQGNIDSFYEIMHPEFVNYTALPGTSKNADGMIHTFNNVLRPAFPHLEVIIYDQVAEGDKVTTRKAIKGVHRGTFMGIAPTNREVVLDVIDIVRLREGRYIEHWGVNTLGALLTSLSAR